MLETGEVGEAFTTELAGERPIVGARLDEQTVEHAQELRANHVPKVP